MNCSIEDLRKIGSGVIFYFYFTKLCLKILLTILIIFGIQSITLNSIYFFKSDNSSFNFYSFFYISLYLNKYNSNDIVFQIDAICLLISAILIMILIQFYNYKWLKNENKIQIHDFLASNYTLMITNMVDKKYEKRDLVNYFEKIWNIYDKEKKNTFEN